MPKFPNDGSQKDNLLFLFCSHQLFRSFPPRVVSDSSCLLISFATPGSHDQGMRELSRVKGLPVPMLTGEKLMGVFSLLVLQSSAFIRMGTGYLDDPPGTCRNQIICPRRKKGSEITLLAVLQPYLHSPPYTFYKSQPQITNHFVTHGWSLMAWTARSFCICMKSPIT